MHHQRQRHHGIDGGGVVFVDFHLAADGVRVDHVSTSLPPKIAQRLPGHFDSAQQGRGIIGEFIFGLPLARRTTTSVVFTTHWAPANQ